MFKFLKHQNRLNVGPHAERTWRKEKQGRASSHKMVSIKNGTGLTTVADIQPTTNSTWVYVYTFIQSGAPFSIKAGEDLYRNNSSSIISLLYMGS